MKTLKVVVKDDIRIQYPCHHWGPKRFELVLFPETSHMVVYSTREHAECVMCVMKWAGEAIVCAQCLKPILPGEPFVVHPGWIGRQTDQTDLPVVVRKNIAVCCVRVGCLLETRLRHETKYVWCSAMGIEQILER